MPLPDVRAIVAAPRGEAADLLIAYWENVERRRAYQRELAHHLVARLSDDLDTLVTFGDIQRRWVPAATVLTESRRVTVDELPGWLPGRAPAVSS